VSVRQLGEIRRAERAAVADDDLAGDRLEGGAEVLHRFQPDRALRGWVNAKGAELLQVEHLPWNGIFAENLPQPREFVLTIAATLTKTSMSIEQLRTLPEPGAADQ
jgi:hypothetical protein